MNAQFTTRQLLPTSPPAQITITVIDWIDRELGDAFGNRCGKGGNTLLTLRKIFEERSMNRIIGRLNAILPLLEVHHYLLGFRIRTLLSSQFQFKVSDPLERTPPNSVPLNFGKKALDQIRRSFFEHAEVAIPSGDIRIEVSPSNAPS